MILTLFYYIIVLSLYVFSFWYLKRKNKKFNIITASIITLYHTCFQILYWYNSLNSPSDSTGYYDVSINSNSDNWIDFFGFGTKFIYFLIIPLAHKNYLNLSYFDCFFLFSYFGNLGILLLYSIITSKFQNTKRYWYLILFLPGLHYWTTAIGKDSLIFFSILYVTYQISKEKINIFKFLIGCLLTIIIRPHIGMILLFAYVITRIISNFKNDKFLKFTLLLIVTIVLVKLTSYFTEQLIVIEISDIGEYLNDRVNYNQDGGSSIDMTNYGYLRRLFTYLFRPFFYDAKNLVWVVVSFENLVYFYLFSRTLRKIMITKLSKLDVFFKFNSLYFFISASLLSYTTSNLGIAIRQKNMFIFNFILCSLSIIFSERQVEKK